MEEMKFYTFEEIKDKHIGKIGTPRRDEYERKVAKALDDYHIGEAIKEARKAKHLTQGQLGEYWLACKKHKSPVWKKAKASPLPPSPGYSKPWTSPSP